MPISLPVRTRFAPTPSGYLHIGNAWNFLLTWLIARSQGGSIHLRIDDLDSARFRQDYLQDIFDSLHWLGLDWDTGPKNPEDFQSNYRQCFRREVYRDALNRLMDSDSPADSIVYACRCSREQIKKASHSTERPGLYPGTCRDAGYPREMAKVWQPGKGPDRFENKVVLRLKVPAEVRVTVEEINQGVISLQPGQDMGDFILWQRNGEPAYQLASVVDDSALGINFIVRGRDLLPSTGAQIFLAQCMGNQTFAHCRFFHHGLLLAARGDKLSKSTVAATQSTDFILKNLRTHVGGRKALFRFFAKALNRSEDLQSPEDFLPHFHLESMASGDMDCRDLLQYLRQN